MKRIVLLFTFSFACLLGACASERDVVCDITWKAADDSEVGTGTVVYEELDDVDAGLEMCKTDQETHDDRPSTATSFTCNCAT